MTRGALYFSEEETVFRMPIGQTSATVLIHTSGGSRAFGLVFNDTHVFFNDGPNVMRAPLNGSGVTAEAVLHGTSFETQYLFAADAENVYLVDSAGPTISAVPLAGGTPRVIVTGSVGNGGRIANGYLYFIRAGQSDYEAARMPLAGGPAEKVGTVPLADFLHIEGSDVYAGGTGGIYHAKVGAPDAVEHLMSPAPSVTRSIDALALSGSRVYWTSGGSVSEWVSTAGTSCQAVVDVQEVLRSSVVLGTDLYVSGGDGIYRIAVRG